MTGPHEGWREHKGEDGSEESLGGGGAPSGPWQGGPGPHPRLQEGGREGGWEAGSSPPEPADGGKSSPCLMKFAE